MFQDLTDSFHNVVDRAEDFAASTGEYYKLRLFKYSMKGALSLVNLLVFGSLSLFVMFFLSIGGALWLGSLFENVFVGFLLIGALYGIALILMYAFGRRIMEKKMLHKFSTLVYDDDDVEPKKKAEIEVKEFLNRTKEDSLNSEDVIVREESLEAVEEEIISAEGDNSAKTDL